MNKGDFELLLDSMERNHMYLVCGYRKMAVVMIGGKYNYQVTRGWRMVYRGFDFYQAMLILEGDE